MREGYDSDSQRPYEPDAGEATEGEASQSDAIADGAGYESAGPPLAEDVLQRWAGLGAEDGRSEEPTEDQEIHALSRRAAPGWVPISVLLVALGLLGAATFIVHRDLTAANQALTVAVNTLAAASGPAGPAQARTLAASIDQGNYDQVVRSLQEMAGRLANRSAAASTAPTDLPNIPPNLAQELGPEASRFFNDRPELLRRLLALAAGARDLEGRGINVDALRPIRDRAVAAAAAGDESTVKKLADEFEARLRSLGGAPQRVPPLPGETRTRAKTPPQDLIAKAQRLEATLKKAASEGRDIRRAVHLAKQAQQAAEAGDMRRAETLLDAAMRAAERAPRVAGPRVARQRPPGVRVPARQPAPGLSAWNAILAMLRAEETDLAATYEAVENAQAAVREANQQQINQLLEEAKQSLERIAHRRNEVSLALGARRRPGETGHTHRRPGEPEPARQRPGELGSAQQGPSEGTPGSPASRMPLPERVAAFLEDVRKMPEAEFQAVKMDLARAVFAMFLPPPPQPGAARVDEEEAERVKEKLRLAAGPYMQRKLSGEDMSELDALLKEARTAIYRGDLEAAEKLIDQALQALGLLSYQTSTQPADEALRTAPAPTADESSKVAPGQPTEESPGAVPAQPAKEQPQQ
ncbi:MAG: hypothetical protein N2512_14405 [Armatimonadetes bacterium]|nr:hypothetical protein [Armatimonadota bacterium]